MYALRVCMHVFVCALCVYDVDVQRYQRGLTEEMPENVHFCIQKAATHSHFIRSTSF